jgi:hypothetical protein
MLNNRSQPRQRTEVPRPHHSRRGIHVESHIMFDETAEDLAELYEQYRRRFVDS